MLKRNTVTISKLFASVFSFCVTVVVGIALSSNAVAADIDVLIIYDDQMSDYYSGSPNTAIYNMVEQANTYYKNSQVDIELSIAGIAQVEIEDNLNMVFFNSEVRALRESTGADFVTYISGSFNDCGTGYVTTNPSFAYSMISRSCMTRSFVHELGHNMGLDHSLAAGSRGTEYVWGIGYGVQSVFSTIMAYETSYAVDQRTYLFSSPSYECSELPCGIANVADAAQALNNVKDRVAAHRERPVSYATFESGVQSVASEPSLWHTVNFSSEFEQPPVVIMGPPSSKGPEQVLVRIQNVSTTGFEFQINEWDYLDQFHTLENVSWVAVVAGAQDWGGLQVYAGKTAEVTEQWKSVSFSDSFDETPAIFAQKEIFDESSASTVRLKNTALSGFDLKLQEEEANDGVVAGETIHYLAVSVGQGSVSSVSVLAGLTGNSITENWSPIGFDGEYVDPQIFSNIQSYIGTDPAALRHRYLDPYGVQLRIEEESSKDAEKLHIGESISWMVLGTP